MDAGIMYQLKSCTSHVLFWKKIYVCRPGRYQRNTDR